MRLIDAPVGLFMSKEGELCLKTEYIADWGVEAYIVSSGETYWGGAKTAEERNNLDVTPVDAVPVPCNVGDVVYGIRNYKGKTTIQKGFVSELFFTKDMKLMIVVKHVCRGYWGEKVFPTYEAAEAAKRKDGEG